MCSNQECAEYFKSQPAYDRCFQQFWKKWKSHGRTAGMITLEDAKEEERRAVGGILGKNLYGKNLRFPFADFERGLQKTRFAPVDMKSMLEFYFGKELHTNKEESDQEQKAWNDFFNQAEREFSEQFGVENPAISWIKEMRSSKKCGYQLLMREYGRSPENARQSVQMIGSALYVLKEMKESGRTCPLAVFAAQLSENPHALDRGTVLGQLLIHAICDREGMDYPESAHQWRTLLSCVNLVPDNVSSFVHVYGLRLCTKRGWHPAYDAFCEWEEPYVITMENLKGVTKVQPLGDAVYIVENEMVFGYLLENLKEAPVTLLCTSGQLRTAAIELIACIVGCGVPVYYSGDTDPDGLGIADRLWQRFGDPVKIWRMSPEDYENSISQEKIGKNGIAKLPHIGHPILAKTAEEIMKKQYCGYQENILRELLSDISGGMGR